MSVPLSLRVRTRKITNKQCPESFFKIKKRENTQGKRTTSVSCVVSVTWTFLQSIYPQMSSEVVLTGDPMRISRLILFIRVREL